MPSLDQTPPLADSVREVMRHPGIWAEAVRAIWAVSPGNLPKPHSPYVRWRALTAYGDGGHPLVGRDLVQYLRWRRRMRRGSR